MPFASCGAWGVSHTLTQHSPAATMKFAAAAAMLALIPASSIADKPEATGAPQANGIQLPQPGATYAPGSTFPPSLPPDVVPPPGYVPGGRIPPGYTVPPIPDFGTGQPTVAGQTYAPNARYHRGDNFNPDNSSGLSQCSEDLQSQTDSCIENKHQEFEHYIFGLAVAASRVVNAKNATALQSMLETFFCTHSRDMVASMVACMPFPPCRGEDGDFVGKNRTIEFCDADTNGTNSLLLFDMFGPNGIALANGLLGNASMNHSRAQFLSFFNCSVTTCEQDTVTAMNTMFSTTSSVLTSSNISSGAIAAASSMLLAGLAFVVAQEAV